MAATCPVRNTLVLIQRIFGLATILMKVDAALLSDLDPTNNYCHSTESQAGQENYRVKKQVFRDPTTTDFNELLLFDPIRHDPSAPLRISYVNNQFYLGLQVRPQPLLRILRPELR